MTARCQELSPGLPYGNCDAEKKRISPREVKRFVKKSCSQRNTESLERPELAIVGGIRKDIT
jgi:hypothetical protein